jgi:hypothetical protein
MSGKRAALLSWLAFAFVCGNVVFDRGVRIGAVEFAQANVERVQQGQPPVTIAAGYQPRVRAAAARAAWWAGGILACGVAAISLASTRDAAGGSPIHVDTRHRRT